MEIRQDQLNEIINFIRKRGFLETDLQYELLDMIVPEIQSLMRENPGMTFEQALHSVHAGLGVHGFLRIEEQVRKRMTQSLRQEVKAEWKNWIKFPHFLTVMGFGILCFQAYRLLPRNLILLSLVIIFILAHVGLYARFWRKLKKYRNTLMTKVALGFTVIFPIVFFQVLLRLAIHSDAIFGYLQEYLWALLFVLLTLIYAFAFVAVSRILRSSILRCESLEDQYGKIVS